MINHGVPERLIDAVIDGCKGFFDLAEEEKLEFKGKHVLDPIRYGTSFNPSVDKVFYWRDFLKVFVHPQFHFPNKPSGFRYLSKKLMKKQNIYVYVCVCIYTHTYIGAFFIFYDHDFYICPLKWSYHIWILIYALIKGS